MRFCFGKIVGTIPKDSFLKGALAIASGTIGAQLVAILASPLLTRCYTPEDFGVLAVFVAFLGIFSVVSSLRYELAIPLARTSAEALNILALAVVINIGCSCLIGLLLVTLHGQIIRLLEVPLLAPYLWLLPIGVIFIGIYRALTFWTVREKAFSAIARTKLTQSFLGLGTQLGIGIAYGGPLGLIVGQIISQSAGMIALGRNLFRRFDLVKRSIKMRRMTVCITRHARFPKFDLAAAAIDTTAANLPQLLLAALFLPSVAGYYLLAWRVVSMPMAFLGQAVGQSLYGHAREAARNGGLYRLVSRIAITLALLILLPLIGIFTWGEQLFTFIFGANWSEAGRYAAWLILGSAVQFIYSPLSLMLMVTNSQHINLAIQIFQLLAKSGALLFGFLHADPYGAIIALALADMLIYSGGIFFTFLQVKRYDFI